MRQKIVPNNSRSPLPYQAPSPSTRVERVVDFLFYLAYTGLGLRVVLVFLHARPDAVFARWVETATEPLHAPFRGILPNVTLGGRFTIALSAIFAIAVLLLLHLLVRTLIRAVLTPGRAR